MRHGIVLFTSDRGITPAGAARAAEAAGFDTLYVPEHTHIPVKRDAAHPGTGDETLPDDQAGRCERFCAYEMALCPGDDACPTSCNESTTPPGQADVDCVAAATTCEETFPCWDFQTFD